MLRRRRRRRHPSPGTSHETLVCTCGALEEGAIEKSSELWLSLAELELVDVEEDDELVRFPRTAAWPAWVARASSPATTMPAAARTTSARLTPAARRFADSIRDIR